MGGAWSSEEPADIENDITFWIKTVEMGLTVRLTHRVAHMMSGAPQGPPLAWQPTFHHTTCTSPLRARWIRWASWLCPKPKPQSETPALAP